MEVPPLRPADFDVVLNGATIAAGRYTRPYREVLLPHEWFLRDLFDIDIDDVHTLVELAATFGPISPWGERSLSLISEREKQSLGGYRELQKLAAELDHPGLVVTADIVRLHLRTLRALSRHWSASSKDEKPSDIARAWTDNGFLKPKSNEQAWDWWEDNLNAALAPFHVRISTTYGWGDESITIYSAAALQLWNAAVEGIPTRKCANETCGRDFIRQEGRAAQGQHRVVGVQFCSKSCAQAQSQRALRRRKRSQA